MKRTDEPVAEHQHGQKTRAPEPPRVLTGLRLTLGCGEALRAQLRRAEPSALASTSPEQERADA